MVNNYQNISEEFHGSGKISIPRYFLATLIFGFVSVLTHLVTHDAVYNKSLSQFVISGGLYSNSLSHFVIKLLCCMLQYEIC